MNTPIQIKDPGFENPNPDKYGSLPTILLILIVICTIGYFANVMDMAKGKEFSDAVRGFGAVFPPLGVLLGFM